MDQPKRQRQPRAAESLRLDSLGPRSRLKVTKQPIKSALQPTVKEPVLETKLKKQPSYNRRQVRWSILALIGFFGLVILVFSVKIMLATNRIITRNNTGGAPALTGKVDPGKLSVEGDGLINILLLGIGGSGHPGGTLSDTMMVVSIDPRTKTAALLSIPRDLWVPIPGHGTAKINAANAFGGPDLAKQVVAKTLAIPIHYYVELDFRGFQLAVDQVGGIDVVNPGLLSDPNYPCDDESRGICPYYLASGSYHLTGTEALKYVRCREGTCGTNFGRENRQRQSLVAIRQKALGLATLTNPLKISNLIDIIGTHLRTDLQVNDLTKLATIAQGIDEQKIVAKGLQELTYSTMVGGQSVVLPKTGSYSQIQNYIHSIFVDSYIQNEKAAIEIQNGTSQAGLGSAVEALLRGYNYNIISMTPAANQNYPTTVLYDYSDGMKPHTVSYLETRFGVKAQKSARPAGSVADLRIIIGADYHAPVGGSK